MTKIPGYYSARELQKLLGVNKQRISNLAREQGWQGERGIFYPAEQVEAYLSAREGRMQSYPVEDYTPEELEQALDPANYEDD